MSIKMHLSMFDSWRILFRNIYTERCNISSSRYRQDWSVAFNSIGQILTYFYQMLSQILLFYHLKRIFLGHPLARSFIDDFLLILFPTWTSSPRTHSQREAKKEEMKKKGKFEMKFWLNIIFVSVNLTHSHKHANGVCIDVRVDKEKNSWTKELNISLVNIN